MLAAESIRRIIYGAVQTGTWTPLNDLYHLVDRSGELQQDDHLPSAPGNPEARWRRNVRNVLQVDKECPRVDWDPDGLAFLDRSWELYKSQRQTA